MKLLFDQNISPKIVKKISESFTGSIQVREAGLEDASDSVIFDFARKNDFTIVTFDSDFVDLNIIKGVPPKIIWLRTGNLTTQSIAKLLEIHLSLIREFLISDNKEDQVLELIKNDL